MHVYLDGRDTSVHRRTGRGYFAVRGCGGVHTGYATWPNVQVRDGIGGCRSNIFRNFQQPFFNKLKLKFYRASLIVQQVILIRLKE